MPIALRPPTYNFSYVPVILQMFYHVSVFRNAVISHRPLPYAWGSLRNYWKGYGESVPSYTMHPIDPHLQQPLTMSSSTSTASTTTDATTTPQCPAIEEEPPLDLPPLASTRLESMAKHEIGK
ncbi:hypothetical protein DM01DRAFT_1090790 [Hesseltinella vesiculosa]|uniref:Uncharacterized protein n=1 Tax=Hesseltinella vesiculosa TaxID=101127 RepID=A0A1X2GCT1_9FUNG|nr:hypothetical protein DM01DRAFT_1090790 [Hesseltinella vesiculosa]